MEESLKYKLVGEGSARFRITEYLDMKTMKNAMKIFNIKQVFENVLFIHISGEI